MRCVQVRNDEEEWGRIRTNHEGLLWETRASFYKENYDLKEEEKAKSHKNYLGGFRSFVC